MASATPDVPRAELRACVLAGGVLEVGDRPVRPPAGTIEVLLAQLLLRPNEIHTPSELIDALWTDGGDDARLRHRLYVAVSRLRAFLADAAGADASPSRLRLVSVAGGYRLDANPRTHDRLAFDALAERAVAGDRDAARRALALASGDPYGALPPSAERDVQRAAVSALRDRVAAVADVRHAAPTSLADQLERLRFLPPEDARAVVPRPRLTARVGVADSVSLVVAVAPAGFGKSTFLAQWASAQSGATAWLELDERDDDPRHLWADIRTALVQAGVVDPTAPPDDAAPGSSRFCEGLVAELAAATGPFVLVVDDAHEVDPTTWASELPRLLAIAPSRLTVAIATRHPLEVPGATDGGTVVHLTADDLRLDPSETLEVVRLCDPTAEPGDVVPLTRVAAGWPIVVSYLSRSGTRPDGQERSLHLLHEYVVDEVMHHMPPPVRDLLLGTAALDRLNAELCDAVTGGHGAAEHLSWLRDQALVLDVRQGGGGWARRHPLVAEALRERAEGQAGIDLQSQHRRAARWFLGQGLPEEALRHAVAAGDDATVAETAGDVIWAAMGRGEIAACRRWLQVIDPGWVIANRADHDLMMIAVQGWADPEVAARWVECRRRHHGSEDDVMAMHVEAHRHYLEGRPHLARQIAAKARPLVGDYFARHPNRPGLETLIEGVVAVTPTIADVLAGEVHHDDPRMAAMAAMAAREMPVMAVWILGEWAFLAWAEGEDELAARLVGQAAPDLLALDEVSAQHGACRLLAATALVDSDRTPDRQEQRRIGQRLAPMVPLFRRLRWDVELVPVLLALHLTALRSGQLGEAGRWLAEADVLLGLCEHVPLLEAARSRVAQASWAGGPPGDREGTLTPQERAVLQHLRAGATYAQVADALGTSHHTVRSQAGAVYRKLGVRNRKSLRAQAADS